MLIAQVSLYNNFSCLGDFSKAKILLCGTNSCKWSVYNKYVHAYFVASFQHNTCNNMRCVKALKALKMESTLSEIFIIQIFNLKNSFSLSQMTLSYCSY